MSPKLHRAGEDSAAVLPEAAGERFAPWLAKAGYERCALADLPPVAIVDLTAEGGPAALEALRRSPEYAALAVLAVVGNEHGDAAAGLRGGADGFISVRALESEFDLRLEAVRKLAAARAAQARREHDLAVLLDLTARYAATLDVAELLHDVTRRLATELAVDRCALVLVDEERAQGHIVAASDDRALQTVRIDLARYPEIREAMRTVQPVVVDDVDSHPLLGEVKEEVSKRGISALAAVPLAVQGKTLGVLLLRSSAGAFRPHEISFAWTVAHATAIALRNARMLEGLRGQAERARERAAELSRYEELFENLSDGVLVLDREGEVASLNPAAAQVLGNTPEQARGKPFVRFAAGSSAPAAMELLHAVGQGKVCRDVDLDIQSGGRLRTISVCASAFPGGLGSILSFRDVSDARAMERELRKTKEFLERLIDSSADAIVALDLNGDVIVYNKSAQRMLGYSPEEALGKLNMRQLCADSAAEETLSRILAGKPSATERFEPTRVEVASKDGERVPTLMSAALITEGGRAVAAVAILSDLRERTKLEAKLSRVQERLQEAEKQAVVVELAGTAAHELNQPLTSVMGYTELLKRRLKADDPAIKSVDIIYREAERMAEIVRKIGKITRYETKAYVGNSRIVDLDRAAVDEDPGAKSGGA